MLDVNKIRLDFPFLNQKINGHEITYLDNSATTQKPEQVINKIADFYYKNNSNIHRSGHYFSQKASNEYESVRIKIKEFINAKNSSEIVFTSGTTESINLIADCFGKTQIKKGDEVTITEMEHHSNIIPWQILCNRVGAKLKVVPFNDDGVLLFDSFHKLITKKTKLVSCTHISNVLGTINPVKEITSIAHENNIPVLIDGAQSVQHIPVDVQDLDCDFFVFSGHKIYAETGIGVLYAKKKWLKSMPPYKYGGGMVLKVNFNETTFADIPLKFEAGTVNISAAISLGEAIRYLEKIGFKDIIRHDNDLTNYALKQLKNYDGINIYGDSPKRCGIISFNLKNINHYDAGMILDKIGIAVRTGTHCAEPIMTHYKINGCIRISFAIYNSKNDIDQLINGLKKLEELIR